MSDQMHRDTPMKTLMLLLCSLLLCKHVGAEDVAANRDIADFFTHSTPLAVSFILSVTAIKITAFVIGYLIVKLGHDTLVRGVTGDIDFGIEGKGLKTKLKAGSPGAFFVLAGAAIILWGLFVSKPLNISVKPVAPTAASAPLETQAENERVAPGSLRALPD